MKRKVYRKWNGCTLEELRYRIVVNRMLLNIEKQRVFEIGEMLPINPFSFSGGNLYSVYLKKVMSVLNYFDAAMKIIRRLREIFK